MNMCMLIRPTSPAEKNKFPFLKQVFIMNWHTMMDQGIHVILDRMVKCARYILLYSICQCHWKCGCFLRQHMYPHQYNWPPTSELIPFQFVVFCVLFCPMVCLLSFSFLAIVLSVLRFTFDIFKVFLLPLKTFAWLSTNWPWSTLC
jgi:hypothetical protein